MVIGLSLAKNAVTDATNLNNSYSGYALIDFDGDPLCGYPI